MKKILFPALILFCIYISGCCSIPQAANYSQLYSFTKEKKKIKGGFASKSKAVLVKDFRENEMLDKDISALKEKVDKYISSHNDLSESTKNNLRELKVTAGATGQEVNLLLGKPDRIIKANDKTYATSQIWVYRINKRSTFTIIVIPVFFTHEAYHLYFKDNVLTKIERHYLEQTLQTSDLGLFERTKSP